MEDLADACLYIMNHYDGSDILNIGTGKGISIKGLAEMIKDVVGFEGSMNFDPSKPDGMPHKVLDVSRLHALGWQSKISLHEGLERTYQWYLDNVV